jgi:hypothetical protein
MSQVTASWQSDWTIILGDWRYNVHRIHLASSDFFKGCFGFPTPETNLTKILPHLCHNIVDGILDYMYGEEIMLKTETLAAYAKAAHILQIANLISKQGFWDVSGVLLTMVVCGCVHLSACLSVHLLVAALWSGCGLSRLCHCGWQGRWP